MEKNLLVSVRLLHIDTAKKDADEKTAIQSKSLAILYMTNEKHIKNWIEIIKDQTKLPGIVGLFGMFHNIFGKPLLNIKISWEKPALIKDIRDHLVKIKKSNQKSRGGLLEYLNEPIKQLEAAILSFENSEEGTEGKLFQNMATQIINLLFVIMSHDGYIVNNDNSVPSVLFGRDSSLSKKTIIVKAVIDGLLKYYDIKYDASLQKINPIEHINQPIILDKYDEKNEKDWIGYYLQRYLTFLSKIRYHLLNTLHSFKFSDFLEKDDITDENGADVLKELAKQVKAGFNTQDEGPVENKSDLLEESEDEDFIPSSDSEDEEMDQQENEEMQEETPIQIESKISTEETQEPYNDILLSLKSTYEHIVYIDLIEKKKEDARSRAIEAFNIIRHDLGLEVESDEKTVFGEIETTFVDGLGINKSNYASIRNLSILKSDIAGDREDYVKETFKEIVKERESLRSSKEGVTREVGERDKQRLDKLYKEFDELPETAEKMKEIEKKEAIVNAMSQDRIMDAFVGLYGVGLMSYVYMMIDFYDQSSQKEEFNYFGSLVTKEVRETLFKKKE